MLGTSCEDGIVASCPIDKFHREGEIKQRKKLQTNVRTAAGCGGNEKEPAAGKARKEKGGNRSNKKPSAEEQRV